MMRYVMVAAMVTASLGLGTGVASAAPHTTPNGWIGSCNMIQDPSMDSTMTNVIADAGLNGWHGNDGMEHSTVVSGGCF